MWDIGKLNPQKLPNLKGSLSLQAGSPKPEENPSLNIDLKIQQLAISGTPWPLDLFLLTSATPQYLTSFHCPCVALLSMLFVFDTLALKLLRLLFFLLTFPGLKVNRLDMYAEKYKPFKGVKYVTKAGKFQVRTWRGIPDRLKVNYPTCQTSVKDATPYKCQFSNFYITLLHRILGYLLCIAFKYMLLVWTGIM